MPVDFRTCPEVPVEPPAPIVPLTSRVAIGLSVPIPTSPVDVTRNLSLPAVSTVKVSLAGNLIAVSVSPV